MENSKKDNGKKKEVAFELTPQEMAKIAQERNNRERAKVTRVKIEKILVDDGMMMFVNLDSSLRRPEIQIKVK